MSFFDRGSSVKLGRIIAQLEPCAKLRSQKIKPDKDLRRFQRMNSGQKGGIILGYAAVTRSPDGTSASGSRF